MDLDLHKLRQRDLKKAVLEVLERAPHLSRRRTTLVGRVASRLGVPALRGKRRKSFDERLERALRALKREKSPKVEEYRTPRKNVRIRLVIR